LSLLPTLALLLAAAGPPVESVEALPKLLEEEYDLLEALDQLDEDRRLQEKLLAENQTKRVEVISRRDRAAAAHATAEERLEIERARIRRRIRVYVELKQVRDWQVMASAGDYASYLRKRRLLSDLLEGDEKRIAAYQKVVEHYRQAKATHNQELAELKAVEEAIAQAQSRLERDKAIKLALLESVRSEKSFFEKADHDLGKAALDLQHQIDNFEEWKGKRLWFRDLKGQYLLPLPGGNVARPYGESKHPRFKTVTMHRGIDFVVGTGRRSTKKVRVIYWGRVAFAGWLKGFGNTVIVDHTKNDYTLYAHLSRIGVKKGDILKSREVIGRIGASGSLDGERLYFELRIDGKTVNPKKWFR